MPDSLSQGDSQALPTDTVSKTPKPSETSVPDSQAISPAPTPKPKTSSVTSAPPASSDPVDDKSNTHPATLTSLPFSQPTPQPLPTNLTASRTPPFISSSPTAPQGISLSKPDQAHSGQSRSKIDSGNRSTTTSVGEFALPSGSSRSQPSQPSQPSHHDSNSGSLHPTTFAFIGAIVLVTLLVGFSLWTCCRCRERRRVRKEDSKHNYHPQGSDSHSFFDKTPPPGFDAYNGLTPVLTREASRQGRHGEESHDKNYARYDSSQWTRSEEMGGPGSYKRLSAQEEKFQVKSLYQDLDFGPLVAPNPLSVPQLSQHHASRFEAERKTLTPSLALGETHLGRRWQAPQAVQAPHSTTTNSLYPDPMGATPLYQLRSQYPTSSSTGNLDNTEERMRHKKDTIVGLAEAYGNANGWGEVELEPMPEIRSPYSGDAVQAVHRFTWQLNDHTTLPYTMTPTLPLPAYHANPTPTSPQYIGQPGAHIVYQPPTRYNMSPSGGTGTFQNLRNQNDTSLVHSQSQFHGQNSPYIGGYPCSGDAPQPATNTASKTPGNLQQTPGTRTYFTSEGNFLFDHSSHSAHDPVLNTPHHFGGATLETPHEYPPNGSTRTIVTGQAVSSADLLPPIQPSPALSFTALECSLSSPTFTTMKNAFESPASLRVDSPSVAQMFGLTACTRTDQLILGTPYGSTLQPPNPLLHFDHAQNPYQGIIISDDEAHVTSRPTDPPTSHTPGFNSPPGQTKLDTNETHYHSPTLSVYDLYNRTAVPSYVDPEPSPPGIGPTETP